LTTGVSVDEPISSVQYDLHIFSLA